MRVRTATDHRAMRASRRIRGEFGVVCLLKTTRGYPRFAAVASRKVGGAVVRNRLKRQLRDIFRHLRAQHPQLSVDVVVIASVSAAHTPYPTLNAWVRDALQSTLSDHRTKTR